MKILAIYDITNDYLRNRVARKCKDFGLARVQKSCFAGDLSMNRLEMLKIELADMLEKDKGYDTSEYDAIYLLPMCETCFVKKILLGHKKHFPDKTKDKHKII